MSSIQEIKDLMLFRYHRKGVLNVLIPCYLTSGAAVLAWLIPMHSTWGIMTILILFGFVSGGLISLSPATIATLSKNPNEYGTRMGMAFTVCAFGALVGNPIAGALLPPTTLLPKGDLLKPGPISPQFRDDSRYVKPWSFAGTAM